MNIKALSPPAGLLDLFAPGSRLVGCWQANAALLVLITEDAGLLHLSVSHPARYPTWDEIKYLRYALLPNDRTFAILFPPKDQYVNLEPNCFHLHEVPEMHETTGPPRLLAPTL